MPRGKSYLIGVFLLLIACSKPPFYSRYKNVENNKWALKQSLAFNVAIADSVSPYNLYINIRNTNQYPYSNIFLVVTEKYKNTIIQIDTLEYDMADASGHWLGTGFSSVKESKLIYKTNYIFPKKGTYTFSIVHAVRKNGQIFGDAYLQGISDVGLSIENIK